MLRDYVRANGLDFLAFVQLPFIQTFYREYFFKDVTRADFDVIIDRADFETGVARLSRMIGRQLTPRTDGDLQSLDSEAADRQAALLNDRPLCARVATLLEGEVRLFNELIDRRP
jgi:hypothetical protein